MDYTFQAGYGQAPQQAAGPATWHQGGQGNAQGRKATPRRRSRRGKKNGGSNPSGAQTQANAESAAQFYPPGNWAPSAGPGPYAPAMLHQPPAAFSQQHMAPPPPPPIPQGPMTAPDQFWLQQMKQMPVLNATAAPSPTPASSPAEVHLQNILGALRQSEETWTPEVQLAVQQMDRSNLQLNLGQVHASVDEIGRAKTEVVEAEAARLRLVTSWRTFLQYSVSRWKEYAGLFQTQESAIQEQIASAKHKLTRAQRRFGKTSEVVRDGTVHISDEEDEESEHKLVKDEDMQSEATQKIAAGLTQVVNSLQELSDQAEAEERKAKRSRTSGEDLAGDAHLSRPLHLRCHLPCSLLVRPVRCD